MLTGIDVSHYDPDLDYARAHREGAAFIVHKASEGTGTDATYARRAPAIRASGAVPGAYHFLRSSPSAAAQVDHFLSVIGDPAGLLVQLDWELSGSDLAPVSMARAWVAEFHRRTNNHPVLLYLPHWVWADHLGSPGGLADLGPLWASHYLAGSALTVADAARVPADWWAGYGGWSRPAILQYAGEAGRIAGTGPADLNVTSLTLADLHRLAGNPTQEDDMTPDEHEWLRQCVVVLGTAYANSTEAGDKPVRDIGQLVWETRQKIDKLAAPTATVDAEALAAALAGNATFVAALAEAVTANLAHRLES
jgi:GH25 family lysozyme M1 (1,4-beta-N-acetylmuramidase)